MNRILKNITVFVLVAVISITGVTALSGSAATSATSASNIEGFAEGADLENLYNVGQEGLPKELTVQPGDEIKIPLTADMFVWDDGRNPLPDEAITLRELRRSKVKVRTRLREGSKVLDYVQLNTDTFDYDFFSPGEAVRTGKTAYISVKFTDKLLSVEDVKFDFDVSLTVDGNMREDRVITLYGEVTPAKIYINTGDDYVDISDGTVVEADDNIRGVKVNMGKGITATRNFSKGQKSYGTVGYIDATFLKREEYAEIYPIVHGVYELKTINMNVINKGVKIEPYLNPEKPEIKEFFVYGEDMQYLGKTTETVAFSNYYILTTEEIPTFAQGNYEQLLEKVPTSERATPATDKNEKPAMPTVSQEVKSVKEPVVGMEKAVKSEPVKNTVLPGVEAKKSTETVKTPAKYTYTRDPKSVGTSGEKID